MVMKRRNETKKAGKKIKGLSLHVLPFSEVSELGISERVKKILDLVLGNKIVILHGRLRAEEEARLIEDTMALVDHVKNFSGIELAVIEPDMSDKNVVFKMRHGIAKKLIGDNSSLTVIGPASVIKDIKRDPKKLELMLS
jgi:hypothetical protein